MGKAPIYNSTATPRDSRLPAVETSMTDPNKNDTTTVKQFESGVDLSNTLLPMLIGGLVLIVVGAIAVMTFV